MSLCGGFRVCAAGVVIYDTVGLQKVCTGGASCSQSRLLCMHHYISLARKSPCGYMCLGNFWADFRFCSQHSFGLTVSTCVAYWCLGCLRQISCPDACTHRHQDMHFCTFAIFYVRACAHSIGFLHQSLPNTKSATSCQVRDVGRKFLQDKSVLGTWFVRVWSVCSSWQGFFKQWTSCRCRPWQIRIRRAQALQLLGLDLEAEKLDRGIMMDYVFDKLWLTISPKPIVVDAEAKFSKQRLLLQNLQDKSQAAWMWQWGIAMALTC